MFVIRHRKIFYCASGLLVAASIFAVVYYGLRYSIEFTGGSLLEVEYPTARPALHLIEQEVQKLHFGNSPVQPTGERGIIVRSRTLTEEEHQALAEKLAFLGAEQGPIIEKRFNSIGPVIGKELQRKSYTGIVVVILMIIFYIAFAFRKVSHPVPSFTYGFMAVIALAHDVILPTGFFALLGYLSGVEIDVLFVTALLTVLGFSVHDTIVVFDRIRENLGNRIGGTFEETVGISLRQTVTRSINTSLTVVLVLLALYFLGGETTRLFALALAIGIVVGTYSSIFIAAPLLVTIEKWKERRA